MVSVLPGTLVAVVVTLISLKGSDYLGALFKTVFNLHQSPVSSFLLAIIIGIALRNTVKFPPIFEIGFKFCVSKILRLGIILLGIRLSILSVLRIGLVAFVIVVTCVVSGIVLTNLLARRFGVSARLGSLIAAGTAICGVSAVVAISPAIGASDEETAYAISTITIFGLIATTIYPYLTELVLGLGVEQAGLFLGTAVHDTAQVVGASYIYDQVWSRDVSGIAITTKLVRNTLMIAVVPILSFMFARQSAKSEKEIQANKKGLLRLFPKFVLGFLAFAVFRSLGDVFISGKSGTFLVWSSPEAWSSFYGFVRKAAEYLLTVAIAGAGLNTIFSKLKDLTLKPFFIGLIAAISVGLVSFIMVSIFSRAIAALIV